MKRFDVAAGCFWTLLLAFALDTAKC